MPYNEEHIDIKFEFKCKDHHVIKMKWQKVHPQENGHFTSYSWANRVIDTYFDIFKPSMNFNLVVVCEI